jgi:hypothetical protein
MKTKKDTYLIAAAATVGCGLALAGGTDVNPNWSPSWCDTGCDNDRILCESNAYRDYTLCVEDPNKTIYECASIYSEAVALCTTEFDSCIEDYCPCPDGGELYYDDSVGDYQCCDGMIWENGEGETVCC